jgi:hypothetical protein
MCVVTCNKQCHGFIASTFAPNDSYIFISTDEILFVPMMQRHAPCLRSTAVRSEKIPTAEDPPRRMPAIIAHRTRRHDRSTMLVLAQVTTLGAGLSLLMRVSASPPQLNVKDFGAVGDGTHDDTDAVQSAIDAMCETSGANVTGGILLFPIGTYCVSRTLNTSGTGNYLMGSGAGLWSYPQLLWTGPVNGTLLEVGDFHSGFRMENFALDGGKRAAHLVHVNVRINPSGSTHNPVLANLAFTGYRSFALILGTNDKEHLAAGELSDVVCNFLVFRGNVIGSSGILINAQNMEIGSLYTVRFDPSCPECTCQDFVDGGTCPPGCVSNFRPRTSVVV